MRSVEEVLELLEKQPSETIANWRINPNEFFEDVLRSKPMGWQKELIEAISLAKQGLPNRSDGKCITRLAVKSGTGVGKTFTVAGIILWMLACFPDCKIPCTAPTAPQLKAVLWPELRKLIALIPSKLREYFPYDPQTDRITFYDNFAVARTAREENPEALQGYHNTNIALIVDEASGVPEAIYMAGQGVMSEAGAVTLLIGNPTRPTGYFFDCFHGDSDKWWTKTVSCVDSPRVTRDYITDMREKHGENSYEFRVRVLGEFHLEDSGLIIPRPWIDEAVERDVTPNSDYIIWGVDVSDGRDKSALAKRMGNILLEPPRAWGGKELMQSVGIIVDEYYNTKSTQLPDEICIDAIGMGTGFVQRLREALAGEPVKITGVNVALTGAKIGDRFTSRRVELWDRGRKWFESSICRIPKGCNELAAQLSSVEWEVKDSNGKWAIVDKHAGGHSPDCFIAGTMVKTFLGETPIEKIKIGQRVLTPSGFRKVIKVWETDADSLATVDFSNGNKLIGKPKHKVFTKNAGFIRMDALSLASDIETYSNKRILKWMFQKLLFSTGKNSGFKQVAGTINQDTLTSMKDYFIGESGQCSMGLYRMGIIFTTLMEIGQIMTSQILSAFLEWSIIKNICLKGSNVTSSKVLTEPIWTRQLRLLKNGMALMKENYGTASMGNKLGKTENQKLKSVLCAIKNLKLFSKTKQNIVQKNAQMILLIKSIKTALENVKNVAKPSLVIDINQPCIVPINVQTQAVDVPVKTYNLTLEEDNVYYANGVLVENCGDAFLLTFGGVKGDKNSFTKKQSGSIFKRNNGANEFGITSASYLQRG